MYDLAIKNGTIVDESGLYKADLYISNGKIAAITDSNNFSEATRTIDASERIIFPGLVDPHMHIGEKEADFEDVKTSTMAAIAGGVTTCIDMPLNLYSPSVLNSETVAIKKHLLSEQAYTDFCVWGGLTPNNLDKLEEMHREGAISFKCFMSAGGNDFYAPTLGEIRRALITIKSFDSLAGFHCEDFSITQYEKEYVIDNKLDGRRAFLNSRPLVSELIAVKNIIELSRETGAKVHICHVSHPMVAEAIGKAKLEGIDITAETCAHYLTFTEDDYLEKGCAFGCAPPLREKSARDGLWRCVCDGTIDCIVSDHSPGIPENRSDKNQPTYKSGYGISGVQTMLQVVYDLGVNKRKLSPEFIARSMSANAAKRWGIYGTKGAVRVGFDADFVIFNPEKKWTINQQKLYYKVKLTAFDGLSGKGCTEKTFIRGTEVYGDSAIKVDMSFGKLIK